MSNDQSKKKVRWGFLLLIAVFLLPLLAWIFVRPPIVTQVVGTYTLSEGGLSDQFVLSVDGTFQQLIVFRDGTKWSATGHWKLVNYAIILDEYFQPYNEDLSLNKNGTIDLIPREPPQRVYQGAFGWEGTAISRWDGRLLWWKKKDLKIK